MRRPSLRAIAIVAVLVGGVLGTAIDTGQARQARGTLAVTVRVVAACSASLGKSPGSAVAAACPSASAPLIVATETATPAGTPATESTTTADSVHYVTLIY